MAHAPSNSHCSTSFVLDKLAGVCCLRIPKYRAPSTNPRVANLREEPSAAVKNSAAKSGEDQMMQFFEHFEKQQAAVMRRKSRFVSEFRNQLVRVPLQHRTRDSKKGDSFVLNESMRNPRLTGSNHSTLRKQRKVSDWAKVRNISFVKSREDMMQKRAESPVDAPPDVQKRLGDRRVSRTFIEHTRVAPVDDS